MNIELWSLGKENNKLVDAAIAEYSKRLNRYTTFSLQAIDNAKLPKTLPKNHLLEQEADRILQKLSERDLLVVLDENGKSLTSVAFAEQLNQWMNRSPQRIIFLIGGSYGVAEKLKARAVFVMSLSSLTFPHQLVRLIFTEQLYRAFTILKNEKYHHE
jgi:23S rRNA (pseudouridine1915-N3)-methyltransferase